MKVSSFFTFSPTLSISYYDFFSIIAILVNVKWYLTVIVMYVPDGYWHWGSFHVIIGHLYIFLWRIVERQFRSFCPFVGCLKRGKWAIYYCQLTDLKWAKWAIYFCSFIWNIYLDLLPIFPPTGLFFIVELQEFFIYPGLLALIKYVIYKYFLPFCGLRSHSFGIL